jgi:molybdate transport system substrate-binding protein
VSLHHCGRAFAASRAFACALCLVLLMAIPVAVLAQPLNIFAASSLKESVDAALARWQVLSSVKARAVYASSAALARQIEHGAPADLFISADRAWMDYLLHRNLIAPDPVVVVASNRLALIAPAHSKLQLAIARGFALDKALGAGRLAMGNWQHVPVGRYAHQALQQLGVWAAVENRLAQAESARAALNFVARAESPLGIVYRSDAYAEPRVRIVGLFPLDLHAPIEYPAGIGVGSAYRAQARSLIEFLCSPQGRSIFVARGFTPVH